MTTDRIPSMSQAEFRGRLHAALGPDHGRTDGGVRDASLENAARTVPPTADAPSLFAERAVAGGMHVRRAMPETLWSVLADLWRHLGASQVAVGVVDPALLAAVQRSIADADITELDWQTGSGPHAVFDADVGVTDCSAAVAETGSLVIDATPRRGRALCLAPPVHVALVYASSIVPDLVDLWRHDSPGRRTTLPSSVVLVSGPSKTADIEGILITGVHGPGAVHVVLVAGN